MKYIKYLLLILVFAMVPFLVYANTCDNADIHIESLELLDKTGSTRELSSAELIDNKISTDIKMYEVGDSIRYQFTVVNDSNNEYALDKNSLMLNNDTIDYKLESLDNSYIILEHSSKDFTLMATYENEVDETLFKGGKYEAGLDQILEIKDPSLINPLTGNMFYYLLIIISIICIMFVLKGKKKNSLLLLLFGLLFLPFSTYAICTYTLDLDVGLKIGNIDPYFCTYDGELTPGVEYTNGQFIYKYKYSSTYEHKWHEIEEDGWGVRLVDFDSTDPVTTTVCTSINDKPIVSMQGMFSRSKTTSIDTSSFDTSNVIYTIDMFFDCESLTSLDVSGFDTSKVIVMNCMFENCESLVSLDLSEFDTSNVTEINCMFDCCYALISLDLTSFDTSNVTEMYCLFDCCYALTSLDLSSFDTSKVTDMDCMFYCCYALTNLDLSNFDTSNVVDMSWMFSECYALTSIDLSSFDTSNVTSEYGMKKMFYKCYALTTLDLSSFDMSNVTNTDDMFEDCTSLTTVYARTQEDIDKLSASSNLPSGVQFILKNV